MLVPAEKICVPGDWPSELLVELLADAEVAAKEYIEIDVRTRGEPLIEWREVLNRV